MRPRVRVLDVLLIRRPESGAEKWQGGAATWHNRAMTSTQSTTKAPPQLDPLLTTAQPGGTITFLLGRTGWREHRYRHDGTHMGGGRVFLEDVVHSLPPAGAEHAVALTRSYLRKELPALAEELREAAATVEARSWFDASSQARDAIHSLDPLGMLADSLEHITGEPVG